MKKNLLYYLFVVLCTATLFTSCSDDDDKAWKNIPQDEIEIQKVTFEVNGEQATTGTLQMAVKNGSEAVLTLKNVIPGYATIPVNVKLEEQADDSFVFFRRGRFDYTTSNAYCSV